MNLIIKKNGFSLVEVLVTISIISILLVMAVPSFKSSKINNALVSEATQINSAFSLARNEAYRRNNYVSVCATTDGNLCNSNDFSKGMIVFSDSQKSGLSDDSQIIKIYDKWSGSDKGKITVNDGSSYFTFNGIPEALSAGKVLICYPGYNSVTLNVNGSGSLKITNNTGDGGC